MLTEKQFTNWVDALRSGKYRQARDTWYNPEENSFCCLGVLGILELEEVNSFTRSGDFNDAVCPLFNHSYVNRNEVFDQLVELNDNGLYSFEQIADWLEEHKSEMVAANDQHQ